MRIGMETDSLAHLSFDELLRTAAEMGIEMLEFPCGNWSSAPHMKLDPMGSAAARGAEVGGVVTPCHCERSEAISIEPRHMMGIASSLRSSQ